MFHNYTEEIAWLKQKLEQNPQSMLYARLAERYIQMNEVDTAEQIVKERLSSQNGYSTPHLILAKCYLKANRFDEADREIKRALQIDPNSLQAYKMQCDIKERIGLDAEVRSGYEKILALDPLDVATKQFLDLANSSQEEAFAPLMEAGFEEETDVLDEPETEVLETETAFEPDAVVEPEADILDVIDEETSEPQLEAGLEEIEQEELAEFVEAETGEQVVEEPEIEKQEFESFLDSEETDVEEKAAQLEEELLLDVEEEPIEAEPAEETFLADEEEMFVESMDSFAEKTDKPQFDATAINDEAILPDIENELEPNLGDDDIEEEETRFSEILDDIFAPTVDEEERRNEETRSTLEKLADDSDDVEVANVVEVPDMEPTTTQPQVEEPEAFSEPDFEQEAVQDEIAEEPVEFTPVEPGQDAFEEFNPFDDYQDETKAETADKFEDAEFEPIEIDDEQETEEQFVDFLASVDSNEPGMPATIEHD
jgi:tetratricopeptide (TPR) repeat protein